MSVNANSVSLAGEFAVLSQLAIRGYDANMTLGSTKGVDILVSDPNTHRMLKLEVKTNSKQNGKNHKLFGNFLFAWMMGDKHEVNSDPDLFYCFVNIGDDKKTFRFFIVPSAVVAKYVKEQHNLWLSEKETHSRTTKMRTFRIGNNGEEYSISTPSAATYEDNWDFNR